MKTKAIKLKKIMQPQNNQKTMLAKANPVDKLEYATKVILLVIFLLLFAGFAYWASNWGARLENFNPGLLDLTFLGFATMRLGRLVAFSRIMEPLRAPFTETRLDDSGAGETVVARGKGVRQALGQMVSCPICAGTWIAAGLVFSLYAFPGPTHLFLLMTAGIGVAELFHSCVEALSWSASLTRARTGETLGRKIGAENLISKENPGK
jgi:hypothetical protein